MIDLRHSTVPEVLTIADLIAELQRVIGDTVSGFVVIGASARNLISVGQVGELPGRATRDVDLAIAVAGWNDYRLLTDSLVRSGAAAHRFDVGGVPVDIVPYGAVEGADRTLRWPDDVVLDVLGLREVAEASQSCELPRGVTTRVPTAPGLAALKLFAFVDRRVDTRRDAVDLATILGWYDRGALLDELYTEHLSTLEAYGFDPVLASACRLGGEMRSVVGEAIAAELRKRLDARAVADLSAMLARSGSDGVATVGALLDGLDAPR